MRIFIRSWTTWWTISSDHHRSSLSSMTSWWFQKKIIPTWGNDPIWRAYFSNGLVQPPTRSLCVLVFPGGFGMMTGVPHLPGNLLAKACEVFKRSWLKARAKLGTKRLRTSCPMMADVGWCVFLILILRQQNGEATHDVCFCEFFSVIWLITVYIYCFQRETQRVCVCVWDACFRHMPHAQLFETIHHRTTLL